MQLQALNTIDLKHVGNLPVAMKAILLIAQAAVLMLLGYMLLINPKLKLLHEAAQNEQALRDQYTVKKLQANKIHAYEKQKLEIEHTFGTLLKQLPDKSEMDALLTDINQAGFGQGLSFEAFIPQEEVLHDFYAEKPIRIKVLGPYHALGAFASDVSKLSRIVTLNDVHIQPLTGKADKGASAPKDRLVMEAVAKTYRYLDAAELNAQKEKEKKAVKK